MIHAKINYIDRKSQTYVISCKGKECFTCDRFLDKGKRKKKNRTQK